MAEGFVVLASSPYTLLAGRGDDEGPSLESAKGRRLFPCPRRRIALGPAFQAELKAALATLKTAYPKPRDLDAHLRVGLALQGAQANVVPHPSNLTGRPADVDDIDVVINPKYLLHGLGLWPAELAWGGPHPVVVVVTHPGQPWELRYWVACMTQPVQIGRGDLTEGGSTW